MFGQELAEEKPPEQRAAVTGWQFYSIVFAVELLAGSTQFVIPPVRRQSE